MKKFMCAYCTKDAVTYWRYYHSFNGKYYYFGYCNDHPTDLESGDAEITYEEFVAAKAMEAL